MRLTKAEGWEERLVHTLEPWVGKPFTWGTSDCAHLTVDALSAMANVPPDTLWGPITGYADPRAAVLASRRVGGALNRLTSLGLYHVASLTHAQRGDVVVLPRWPRIDATGIVWGPTVLTTEPGYACSMEPLSEVEANAVLLRMPVVGESDV